jgi:hypothetical protein
MNRRTILALIEFAGAIECLFKVFVVNLGRDKQQRTTMNIAKDFTRFFKDGFSFQFDYQDGIPPFTGLQTVKISVLEIGKLVITSGKLSACDPLLEPNLEGYFKKTIPPGHHPVIISIAELQPLNDTRIAYAMLRLSNEPVVKWEIAAVVNNQYPRKNEGEDYGYGVDSGTGCFMDLDVAQTLHNLANPDQIAYEAAVQAGTNEAWKLTLAALERFEREFCDKVILAMNHNGRVVASWANVLVHDTNQANVIAFSSGWGDGGYSSYWGYDVKGNLASLVTDFVLLEMDEN